MKKKIILFIFIIIFVYAAGGIAYVILNKKAETVKISDLDSIKGYNYTLKSNATELYKSEFKALKSNLENNNVNDEEFAKSVAKLFIIDLYTLSNKINKYDVGGINFVHPDYLSNYKLNVEDTLYKYMEDNTTKGRKQELPEVSTIEIKKCEEATYKIGEKEETGYKIELEWSYVKDLGYDKDGEVIIVKLDKNYYIVEKN